MPMTARGTARTGVREPRQPRSVRSTTPNSTIHLTAHHITRSWPSVLSRIILTVAMGIFCLSPPSVAAASHLRENSVLAGFTGRTSHSDKVLPKIVIASPAATSYRLGQKLLMSFSCTDRSGIAHCTATLGRAGAKAVKVTSGAKVRLSSTGRYRLRITAHDRAGNSRSTTLNFYVVRTVAWSGYTWTVRFPGAGWPGPNAWSDSQANVHVSGSGLFLSITKDPFGRWASAELDNQRHLGYGTYRWVVASDLSTRDANDVLGMFTYGGPAPRINEIDIETSHWGNFSWPTGSGAVRQNTNGGGHDSRVFNYSNQPPYVNQFTWAPGRVSFLVTDATGATLLSWTATNGVPKPSIEVPIINYWRFNNVAPAGVRTIHISSFTWAPLGRSLPPVAN
jgi:hypothetical protein